MISPEQLRRLPLFALVSEPNIQKIAMIAEERCADRGTEIFETGQQAESLFILLRGTVDLLFSVDDASAPMLVKEFMVGEVNPGEVFGISGLIEPHIYTSSARVAVDSVLIVINSEKLCALCDEETGLGYLLMKRMAKAALQRLEGTRILLAACWNK
jgi:CRP-like cAMP-binding protein